MSNEIMTELQDLKQLTLIGAKHALRMNEAAIITGLSKSHLYKLVSAKRIPYCKSPGGKLTYFDRQKLDAWMLQNPVKPADEIEREAADYAVTGKHSKKGGVK
jgi:excisionase family DNA binding protein